MGSKVIEAAREAGNNPHIIYSSGLGAERRQSVAAIDGKVILEDRLRSSGLPFTILRPGLFMDDFRGASLPFARPIQRVLRNHRPLVGRLFLATVQAMIPKNSSIPLTTLQDVGRIVAWVFEHQDISLEQAYQLIGSVETPDTLCMLWQRAMNQSIPHVPILNFGIHLMHPKMATLLEWLGQYQAALSEPPLLLQTYGDWLSSLAR